MMTILDLIGDKWKNKYTVKWCESCDCAYIVCEKCQNSSCNGGGCDKCHIDFKEFCRSKIRIEQYLNEEERKVLHKSRIIRDFMIETLNKSEPQIDFKKLNEEGKLSSMDRELFL